MNCPTCGAPNVMLHKDIWECGWCGDSGPIPRRILEQRKAAKTVQMPREITLTLSIEPNTDCDDVIEPSHFFDPNAEKLAKTFPEEMSRWTLEQQQEMYCADMLEEVYADDPQKAITMWRSLLPDQTPMNDSNCAEGFFSEIDFLWDDEAFDAEGFLPLLDAMQADDSLSRIIFQSGCVCQLHFKLLKAAIEQDMVSEAAYLFALLKANSFSRGKWAVSFSQFQTLMCGIPLPPVDTNVMHTEKLRQKIPLGTAKEEPVSANEDTSPTLPSETKPSHKGGKAVIIIGCLLLIGLLSFLAMQDISEKPPATIRPSHNNKPSVTQSAAPSKTDVPTAQPTTPGQTFNYGGGTADTGPGSGHSLREDYGDPEDLYEDGDYDDLDEAWDEWEEGW